MAVVSKIMKNDLSNTKFTFFWSGPFSQWHPSSFKDSAGIKYSCAEQYMMYQKALVFNDMERAEAILKTGNPKEQKRLGRLVANYDDALWVPKAEDIVYQGSYYKYTQNLNLKKLLFVTAGTTLVEASPRDNRWGVGLSEDDPRILDPATWRGENKLGFILTKLRDNLINEESISLF